MIRTSKPLELEPHEPVRTSGPSALPVIVILVFVAWTVEVDAYIDPGTGSYLFQLAAAGVFAALFVVKRYWRAIKGKLRSLARTVKDRDRARGHEGMD